DSCRFRDLADLRGLVFATAPPINAGAGYPALARVLSRAGLTPADLRTEAMGFPELNAALASKAIDVAIQGDHRQIQHGEGRDHSRGDDASWSESRWLGQRRWAHRRPAVLPRQWRRANPGRHACARRPHLRGGRAASARSVLN